jgi:nanoRNase/pAp phosphatase (c-di-AMP/oligoRNAs hydrolase)
VDRRIRYVLICPEALLEACAESLASPEEAPLLLVTSTAARARMTRHDLAARVGDVGEPATYRRLLKHWHGPLIVAASAERTAQVLAAVRAVAAEAPVLLLGEDLTAPAGVTVVPLAAVGEQLIRPALERAAQRTRADRLRAHFEGAERVLILMQDDPDPDAIASGLALRTLLGRNRASAPLCTFGTITRPENVAMCKILDLEVEEIDARALDDFDRVAMVDVQPSFLSEPLDEVDLVIDHHPVETPIRARLKDVRPAYGATATILVEYLRAADVKITQRLATALLYGIKSDTLGLERGGTRPDLDAFAFLYPLANHNAMRRIERPELSEAALDVLTQGLARRRIVRGVFFAHLGPVGTVDLIPQFAEFGLQAEGVEWSVVSGVVNDTVHVSVRNVGYVKSAGDVVRTAFGDLGSAGGHRTMAKAVFPARLLGGEDVRSIRGCPERIIQRFLRALGNGPR